MLKRVMHYWPNPAHKRETSEAGPPRWRPNKSPCPSMSTAERSALLQSSVPLSPEDPYSPRYAIRRHQGKLEIYQAFADPHSDPQDPQFHGFPWRHPDFWPRPKPIPTSVLRELRDRGELTNAEYLKALKDELFD